MSRIFHPIFYLLASATRQELARQVEYLKIENQVLRAKLPKRLNTTPDERRRLAKAARGIKNDILKQLIGIASPATFLKWLNKDDTPKSNKTPSTRKPGRPRTSEEIRELVIRIAKETGWGYTRILGELRRLGIRKISRQTVKNILKEHGLDPGPKRGKGSWDEFLKIHWSTLWQSDFLSKRVWTWKGPIDLYLLVFIQVGSRKVWVSSATAHPDSVWVAQQARNFCMDLPDDRRKAIIMHDGDTKFTEQFRAILRSEGLRPQQVVFRSPNLNAFVERFVQTIKQECLDHFVVLGERHLNRIVSEFVRYYHGVRPHQSLENRPPGTEELPEETLAFDPVTVVCHEALGGLLKHYERRAA